MIAGFRENYRFLSNFYPAPVLFEGVLYPTSEHAYQASKFPKGGARRQAICSLKPREAKRYGQTANLDPDWNTRKFSVMEEIIREKFGRHKTLAQKLLETGDEELIELTTWDDTTWGVIEVEGKFLGQNNLGKCLMKIREELKNAST